ncbi:MAG: metallophosphoesterase [Bacteroidales bacterium]|nr:metallophosphoesterase [Bacteroidales bacterium]
MLNTIISQIGALSPKPSFVIFGGDMSYRGYIGSSYTFQAFKDLFAPLGSGIPLYTAVGNHELYHEHSAYGFLLVNQQAFQNAFPENPTNGPAGYEHLTYSFTSPGGSSFFAVLDPYYLTQDTTKPATLGGHIDSTQMAWLKAQVALSKATHKFLFIHTPYYYISDDPEEPSSADTSYTKLWAFLDANKFDFYACGHSHLFSRRTIDGGVTPTPQTVPATPAWQNNVVQLLNGTCGAGPSTGAIDPAIKTAWNVHNDAKTYYFSVVDISGSTVTVNSYSGYTGAYSVFDTFTINK